MLKVVQTTVILVNNTENGQQIYVINITISKYYTGC